MKDEGLHPCKNPYSNYVLSEHVSLQNFGLFLNIPVLFITLLNSPSRDTHVSIQKREAWEGNNNVIKNKKATLQLAHFPLLNTNTTQAAIPHFIPLHILSL